MAKHRVLGISGSLRSQSTNSLFLRVMACACPDTVSFKIYSDLGRIPIFNPDDEAEPGHVVTEWRETLLGADMILLASPEYVHGVPGVIKNAFDWIASSGELMGKLLAFPNISSRASIAHAQLAETLHILGTRRVEECSPKATLDEPLILPDQDVENILSHPLTGPRIGALWTSIEKRLDVDKDGLDAPPSLTRYLW